MDDLRFDHEKLAEIRIARVRLQADVAESVGVSRSTYSRWEAGETEPSATQLMALAAYLRRRPVAFFS
jgi:transcriptional regulator with XRE-family HTH domain